MIGMMDIYPSDLIDQGMTSLGCNQVLDISGKKLFYEPYFRPETTVNLIMEVDPNRAGFVDSISYQCDQSNDWLPPVELTFE